MTIEDERRPAGWLIWPEGDEPSDGYEFPATAFFDATDAVETTADRYHGDGGGEWQHGARVFRVRAPDGVETVWTVEIDYSPSFTAWQKAPTPTETSDGR